MSPISRATLAGSGGGGGDVTLHEAAPDPHPQYPTEAEVEALVAAVVDAAPAALDTLNEIAAALGDDANFAGTITTQLAGKADSAHNHDAAYAATAHSHVDADLPAGLARDTEVTAAVAAHAAASDPHPTYLTQAEGDGRYRQTATALVDADIPAAIARDSEVTSAVSTHAGQTHSVDQPAQSHDIVTKHTASGLTAGHVMRASSATAFSFAALQDADLPSTIARDSEVTSAVSTHAGAADPHTGYQLESEKGAASGYASLDATTKVPVAQLATGTPDGTKFLRDDRTWVTPAGGGGGTPSDTVASETSFGVSAAAGAATAYARGDHTHGTPTNPVTAHEAAGDPHPVYLTATEGNAAYATAGHTHTGLVTGGAMRKTANQTMTATAATAVTDMAFNIGTTGTYVFQMHLSVTTSTGTSPTTNWAFTGPAGATVAIVAEIDTSTSIESSVVITSFTSFGALAQVASTGAKFHGVIVAGGTAGTVQLTAARGGTTPSMVVPAGCNGFYLQVA